MVLWSLNWAEYTSANDTGNSILDFWVNCTRWQPWTSHNRCFFLEIWVQKCIYSSQNLVFNYWATRLPKFCSSGLLQTSVIPLKLVLQDTYDVLVLNFDFLQIKENHWKISVFQSSIVLEVVLRNERGFWYPQRLIWWF